MIDDYGRHELLDRTYLLLKTWEDFVLSHPDIEKDEEAIANLALDQMYELYQLIGERHLK